MKTVQQALADEVHWSLPDGFVENVCIRRGIDVEEEFTRTVALSIAYRGALADCLSSLVQAINFNEADKSFGNLTDAQRRLILRRANALYSSIGEAAVETDGPRIRFL